MLYTVVGLCLFVFIIYRLHKSNAKKAEAHLFAVGDKLVYRGKGFKGVEFEVAEVLPKLRYRIVCTKGKVLGTNNDMVYNATLDEYTVDGLFVLAEEGKA